MEYGSMDDIILKGPNYQNEKKKGKAGKIILFLFVIIIIGGAAAGYWYYTKYILQTPKKIFFKYVGQNNITNVLDTDVYYDMISKISKQSFSSESTVDFTTTMKSDFTQLMDVSKLDIVLNISSNKTSDKSMLEAKIAYSSNDLFSVKLLDTKDSIGIASDEILDKYIATSKTEFDNSIEKTSSIDTDISADVVEDTLNDITKNKIELDDNSKSQIAKDYLDTIYNSIPEEAVTQKPNVVVTIDSETINTDAYTLTLTADQYKAIYKAILEKVKNDELLINGIVAGEEEEKNKEKQTNTVNPITTTQIESVEATTEQHQTESTVSSSGSFQLDASYEPETVMVDQVDSNVVEIPAVDSNSIESDVESEEDAEIQADSLYIDLLKALVLEQKINSTAEDLKDRISTELSKTATINEGISITIYVANQENRPKETVKMVAELKKDTSIDIEYTGNTKFKVTFLSPEEDSEGKTISSGASVQVEKKSSDVNVKYNVQYNIIENKKVVEKTQIDLETDCSNPSKGYTNNIILNRNNEEGNLKVNIKNKINFGEDAISEELTEENSIFIDKLSDEEAQVLYNQIKEKALGLYLEKMANLAFIDNNSSNSIIEQPSLNLLNIEEKAQIKAKLIEKVSVMMGEAIARGETFTIQNLADLSVDGYNVSCIISEDLAVIKINGYTFNIDKDFNLSEE